MFKLVAEPEFEKCSVASGARAREIEAKFLNGMSVLAVFTEDRKIHGIITFEDFVDKGYFKSNLSAGEMSRSFNELCKLKDFAISLQCSGFPAHHKMLAVLDSEDKVKAFFVEAKNANTSIDHVLKSLIASEVEYCREHFSPILDHDPDGEKRLFSESMHSIQMETSSFCNRRCPYCILSTHDRSRSFTPIDPKVYDRLMSGLQEIDYNRIMDFHLFNEPLYDRDYILGLMKKTRKFLPKAFFRLVTNGDYLNRSYLDELYGAGVGEFIVTRQFDGSWDNVKQDASIRQFIEGLSLDVISYRVDIKEIKYQVKYNDAKFTVQSVDFLSTGNDRGICENVVKHIKNGGCNRPFNHFSVTYDGNCFPCCVMSPTLKEYSIGSLKEASIFDIFASAKACNFRKAVFRGPTLPGCCKNCYSDTVYVQEAARRDYVAKIMDAQGK
jgi:sulfatase maturation enzyme AslB (radical SAM superfamily)